MMESANPKKRASDGTTTNGNGTAKKANIGNGNGSCHAEDSAESESGELLSNGEKVAPRIELSEVPDEYKANGLKTVTMRVIKDERDLLTTNATEQDFKPAYVYQYFKEPGEEEAEAAIEENGGIPGDDDVSSDGASEAECDDEEGEDRRITLPDEHEGLIVGYKDLGIKLFFTPATLKPFVSVSFTEALPPAERSVSDLVQAIENVYGHKVMTTTDAMLQAVKEDAKFNPVGRSIGVFTVIGKDNVERKFELFEVGLESQEVGYPTRFSQQLAWIQPVLQWFIYAANIVTTDNANWLHYFLYEKTADAGYQFVGYSSVYRFTMWPKAEKAAHWTGQFAQRCRIAQFFILPPYQKSGHGCRMLMSIISRLQENPQTYEITVEDATPDFQKLFDSVTTYLLRDYISSKNLLLDFKKPPPADLIKEMQKKLKFSPGVIKLAVDVLACSSARREGQEAVKEYYEKVTAGIQNKIEENITVLDRSWRRVQCGYYSFLGDDTGDEERLTKLRILLRSGWQFNYQDQKDVLVKLLTPEKIGRAVLEVTERMQQTLKRVEEIS